MRAILVAVNHACPSAPRKLNRKSKGISFIVAISDHAVNSRTVAATLLCPLGQRIPSSLTDERARVDTTQEVRYAQADN